MSDGTYTVQAHGKQVALDRCQGTQIDRVLFDVAGAKALREQLDVAIRQAEAAG